MTKKIRMKTRDAAFLFRMGAGFPGDVNRAQPARIEPTLIAAATPPTAYGQAVLIDSASQGVRPYAAGDQSNTVASGYGITVRPFPTQQASGGNFGAASLGVSAPPATGVIDVLRTGYIIVSLPAGGSPRKGDPVYIWSVASAGANILGSFTAAYSAGNTTQLKNATFNGTPDANGFVEIVFGI